MGALIPLAVRLAGRAADALGIPLAGLALFAGLALGAAPGGFIAWLVTKRLVAIEARAETNSLRQALAEARLDASNARVTASVARFDATRNASAKAQAEKQNDEYKRELAKRGPLGACGFSDADLRRMRGNPWARERRARRPPPSPGG